MDLMEYQGKELFRRLGIPTSPRGDVATTPDEAQRLAEQAGVPVMVKAQVLTGGRGKAGGVKYCADADAARAAAEAVLGLDIKGHVVGRVLVEPASDIGEEYYLSVLHDRVSKGYKIIASVEGGVEIEQVNRTTPEKVVKADVDPTVGLNADGARSIIQRAGLPDVVLDAAADLLLRLYAGFVESDATLFEVNPLIRTSDDRIIALDSKVSIDNNALFRHPDLAELDDADEGDSLEARARANGLQYVKLDGDIGIMGNGAGLVMSTLDVVNQEGGRPANFLDAGGGASADSMAAGIAFVLADPQVKVMLVNIFGGITRCDDVARGVLGALERIGEVPQKLVVRLDGTNAEQGRRLLDEADHPNLVAAEKMNEAAAKAVALVAQS
ncbi:MAG: ADP-forming succinate--CoA ligase subunit beta [Actinomycetota bacterium]|nr:ADP-forming succinate--CoA ligase subunit beta [Actinomycetota bacterium]MDQ3529414.1 ADP-forming succinate--CoA ligase subunit beta [Actinomycetota bacterium]